MLHFSSFQRALIYLICVMSIILAIPNFLSENMRKSLPQFMPNSTINLGLDLRGGSHLLLEADFPTYLKDQVNALKDVLKSELRKNKIFYNSLDAKNNIVSFRIKNIEQKDQAWKLIKQTNDGIIIKYDDNKFEISFNEEYIQTLKASLINQSIEIIRRRVDETGTREPIIQKQGELRIVLQVPGMDNPDHLKMLLGKTAKLTFHIVDEMVTSDDVAVGINKKIIKDEERQGLFYVVDTKPMLSGDALIDARATVDQRMGNAVVNFRFNTIGAKIFGEITKENSGKMLAIVLDNKVISAPRINEPILGGSGIIQGSFTIQTANDLALLLRAGALPAELNIVEERSIGPSLGADSIESGKKAAIVGMIMVVIFMILNYGLFGVFANIALIFNMMIIISLLTILGATLTMPGIAAIILTIGMAVDANVLIYERIREELRHGMSPIAACDRGFKHVMSAIFDSNLTTMIVAILLYIFGTGPIKSFAVSLAIGIFSSLIAAMLITRLIISTWIKHYKPKTIRI
jgi:preprotein translocase subunit SecD